MTYVIFKGTKTASGKCVSLFPAEPRDDNPHLTASGYFSTLQEIEQELPSQFHIIFPIVSESGICDYEGNLTVTP